MDGKTIGEIALAALLVAKGLVDIGLSRLRTEGDRQHRTTVEQRFNGLDAAIAEVRAFVVGPDGENGIRGDAREIKARVIGLEERELERLAAQAARR